MNLFRDKRDAFWFYVQKRNTIIYVYRREGRVGIYHWIGNVIPKSEPTSPLTLMVVMGTSPERVWELGCKMNPGEHIWV